EPDGGRLPTEAAGCVLSEHFAGAKKRRRPLKLLNGQHTECAPHENRDTTIAARVRPLPGRLMESAKPHRERGDRPNPSSIPGFRGRQDTHTLNRRNPLNV